MSDAKLIPYDFSKKNHATILVVGESGIGKTSLIKTIGKDKKVLIFDFERGLKSVTNHIINNKDNITAFQCFNFEQIKYITSQKSIDGMAKYDYVVFDSITRISAIIEDELRNIPKFMANTQQLYGELAIQMMHLVLAFSKINTNIIVTALPLVDNGITSINLRGGFKNSIRQYFDFVFTLIKENDSQEKQGKRYFITDTSAEFPLAKSRDELNILEYKEEANLKNIFEKILNENKEIIENKETI